jgi:hypothetical protein
VNFGLVKPTADRINSHGKAFDLRVPNGKIGLENSPRIRLVPRRSQICATACRWAHATTGTRPTLSFDGGRHHHARYDPDRRTLQSIPNGVNSCTPASIRSDMPTEYAGENAAGYVEQ